MPAPSQPQGRNLEGKYANYFELGRNANELVIDFGQFYGHAEQPVMHTRIIIVPAYARDFVRLLNDWLQDASPLSEPTTLGDQFAPVREDPLP